MPFSSLICPGTWVRPEADVWTLFADRVLVVTSDGRCYVGVLKACDQTTNIVLSDTVERIYSSDVRTPPAAARHCA